MAIGLGRLFGFRFLENFNYPYESRTVTEFWRRWHISLSTWFREYVYIPLGGNRRGLGRQLLNIAIVWFLTGLWHGASWNFVLWGVYYAALLLLEKTFLLKKLDRAPHWVGHVYTCLCFILGWVLFAITDFGQLGAYLGHMFSGTFFDGTAAYLLRSFWLVLVLAALTCVVGVVLVFRPMTGVRALTALMGLSLLCDGVLNLSVALCTVKIVDYQRPDVIETDDYEIGKDE